MARPLRIAYPGALYHITSRGNERKNIFFSDEDRQHFLRLLANAVEHFAWVCFAYCLMDNHYHLVLETALANISQGMKYLNGVFTQYMNWKHRRVGHLLQGRFHAELIEKESYFLEVCRYVPLNPVRAKICADPAEYKWSSYQATRGIVPVPPFLTIQPILDRFGSSRAKAQQRYETFVRAGIDDRPFDHVRGGIFLGSDAFIERHQGEIDKHRRPSAAQSRWRRPPLVEVLKERDGLQKAAKVHGYSTREIAGLMQVHQSTIVRRLKNASPLGSGPE